MPKRIRRWQMSDRMLRRRRLPERGHMCTLCLHMRSRIHRRKVWDRSAPIGRCWRHLLLGASLQQRRNLRHHSFWRGRGVYLSVRVFRKEMPSSLQHKRRLNGGICALSVCTCAAGYTGGKCETKSGAGQVAFLPVALLVFVSVLHVI